MTVDCVPAPKLTKIEPFKRLGFYEEGRRAPSEGCEYVYLMGAHLHGWWGTDLPCWFRVKADARVEIHELLSIEDAAHAFLNFKWDDKGMRMTTAMLRALCGRAPDDATSRLFWQAVSHALATDTTA